MSESRFRAQSEAEECLEEALDTDCPVCKTTLNEPAFLASNAEDIEVSDTVFRLKCGHAFHMDCLCRCLRLNSQCPVCRQTAGADAGSATGAVGGAAGTYLEIELDQAGNITGINAPGLEPEASDVNYAVATEMSKVIEQTGRNHGVQLKRKAFKLAKKKYRKLELELLVERAQLLKTTMRKFKDKYHNEFESAREHLNKRLKALKKAEMAEAAKIAPHLNMSSATINDFVSYDLNDILGHGFGPLDKRFWK